MDPKKLDLAARPIQDRGVLTVRESSGAPVLTRALTRPSSQSPNRVKIMLGLPVSDEDVNGVAAFCEFRLEMN